MEPEREDIPSARLAPARTAPAPGRPPWSKFAVATFVASLVLAFVAFGSGLALLALPAVVLGGVAITRTKRREARGRRLAVAALVIATVGGVIAFLVTYSLKTTVTRLGRGVLAALSSRSEPQRLDDWLTPAAIRAGSAARIRGRYEAVTKAYGPYQGELAEAGLMEGTLPYLAVDPAGLEPVGPPVAEDRLPDDRLRIWATARFRDRSVHVCFYLRRDPWAIERVNMAPGQNAKPAVLEDLGFFVDR